MKKLLFALPLLLCFLVACSEESKQEPASESTEHPAVTDTSPKEKSSLFILSGNAGSFDGNAMLSFSTDSGSIVYFNEKPGRAAGDMSFNQFAETWQNDAADSANFDPPNAALKVTAPDGTAWVSAVEVLGMKSEGEQMQFDVKVLEGEIPPAFVRHILVIDAEPTSVNSQITDS